MAPAERNTTWAITEASSGADESKNPFVPIRLFFSRASRRGVAASRGARSGAVPAMLDDHGHRGGDVHARRRTHARAVRGAAHADRVHVWSGRARRAGHADGVASRRSVDLE